MATELHEIKNVLGRSRHSLLEKKNIVATGIGYKVSGGQKTEDLSIVCSVTEKLAPSGISGTDMVPKSIDGLPTDVVQTGRIRALQLPTDRHRPAPGGVSIGHFEITAGTLGCLVKKNGVLHILSNNHVLANSNDATIGDAILQPGPHDNGSNPADKIAELTEFVTINFTGIPSECPTANGIAGILNGIADIFGSNTRLHAVTTMAEENLVDAAIARPLNPDDVKNEILNIGAVNGSAEAELGMAIKKSGRTTGFTTGEILQVDVTVNVQYGAGKIATFRDQLMAGAMSQGGDSGSAVLDDQNRLVGLLFAGSDQSTIVNRIQNVFSTLGVSL
ncbi:MAG: hypothetical protein HKM93_11345 [Desulfobacteraceae bacterium]|nr:hypothetical protein [Desulfobacteraceae bacterium]